MLHPPFILTVPFTQLLFVMTLLSCFQITPSCVCKRLRCSEKWLTIRLPMAMSPKWQHKQFHWIRKEKLYSVIYSCPVSRSYCLLIATLYHLLPPFHPYFIMLWLLLFQWLLSSNIFFFPIHDTRKASATEVIFVTCIILHTAIVFSEVQSYLTLQYRLSDDLQSPHYLLFLNQLQIKCIFRPLALHNGSCCSCSITESPEHIVWQSSTMIFGEFMVLGIRLHDIPNPTICKHTINSNSKMLTKTLTI